MKIDFVKLIENKEKTKWEKKDKEFRKKLLEKYLNIETKEDILNFIEKRRVIPEGLSPIPGYYRYEKTPYLIEIVRCFDVSSNVQIVDVMKGAQIGATVGLDENILLYIVGVNPQPTLFLAHTAGIAESIFEARVDPAIDYSGLRHLIKSQSKKKANKNTGDTKGVKYFSGGFIQIGGLQSISKLKAFSIKTLIITEADESKTDLGGQGDPVSLAERRLDAFSSVKKILVESTPTVYGSSIIETRFNLGDKRYYFVPCKKCGKLQKLEWKQMRYELNSSGHIIDGSVFYECIFCGDKWTNADEEYFLKNEDYHGTAKWISTEETSDSKRRSYHISSLYSPIGFRSWSSICEQFVLAEEAQKNGDSSLMKVFYNQVLGETFREIETAPEYEKIYTLNRAGYQREYFDSNYNFHQSSFRENLFEHPPLFCTLAADIQKHYIETGVILWSKELRSYSLGYHRFYGKTEDIADRCWKLLEELIKTKHCGLHIDAAFIDEGYVTPQTRDFCEMLSSKSKNGVVAFPVKGYSTGKMFSFSKDTKRSVPTININVDLTKQEVYTRLALKKIDDNLPRLWCSFPNDFDVNYFKMLLSEERRKKYLSQGREGFEWYLPKGRRNEALDIFGYNIAAAHFLIDSLELKNENRFIDWQEVWTYLSSENWKNFTETDLF